MTKAVTTINLANANLIVRNLHEQARNCDFPDFGSNMLSHHSFSVETAAAVTQRSRLLSKFFEPSASGEKLLREACFTDWIAYEERLYSGRLYSRLPNGDRGIYRLGWWDNLTSETKRALFKARDNLHRLYKGFKIDLHNADVDFTPGETNWSSGGKVSVLQKLKNLENWQVTADAFEDFCRLAYHNASLKRAAKAHFPSKTRKEVRELNKINNYSGYHVFRTYFEEMVTITYGSVGDSVPKNNEKRRFINKEPMGNMLLQRLIARKLRLSLQIDWYNHVETGQAKHRSRIAASDNATIDFSNASDSIHMDLAYFLLPAALRKLMFRWRSEFVLLDDTWHQPEKLCSMGNGFCFEILTLTLLSIARTLDANSSVYGDDVIISNDAALSFTSIMSTVGFTVNDKKSFISSRFRESCGAFYYEGAGYLETYDFKWIENPNEFIITCNKLQRIVRKMPDGKFRDLCKMAWEQLLSICPPLFMGPSDPPTLERWVGFDRYTISKRKDTSVSALRTKLIEKCWLALHSYQVPLDDTAILGQQKFISNSLTPIRDHVTCPFQLGHYLYGNRRSIDRVRGNPTGKTKREKRGLWQESNFFLLPTGLMYSVKEMQRYSTELLMSFTCAMQHPQFRDLVINMAKIEDQVCSPCD